MEKRKQEYGPGPVGIPSAVFSLENGSLASSSVGDYNWEVILHYIYGYLKWVTVKSKVYVKSYRPVRKYVVK